MAIKTSQGFKITSDEAIDANLTLTKSEMKNVDENLIPDKYFTICQDDGKLYLFNKANTVDEQIGKFRVFEGGSGGSSEWGDITGTLSNQTDLQEALDEKQEELVSGTNIKTINNMSILGNGNLDVSGGAVPENIMTARATTGAGNVDIYSMTGSSNEYTPVDDKVTMDLRVIQGGTYSDLPELNISTAGAGNPIYNKHLATTDYVDTEVAKKQDTLTAGTNITIDANNVISASGGG